MRTLVLVVLLAACDKGKSSPPPPAAPAQRPIDASVADASPDADLHGATTLITRAGVGSLGKVEWWKLDEQAMIQRVAAGLPLHDTKVSFDVMELPFVDETEEGYYSIKRGEEELAQVLRTQGEKGEQPAAVVVWTKEIPMADGVAVGDKVYAIIKRHPDLGCTVDMYGTFIGMIAVYVACTSPAEPEITYFVDVGKQVFKNGTINPMRLANLAIVGIGHEFVGP